jgi:hypothetical protein
MSGSDKNAVDLFLEDVAKYLEDGCATDGLLSPHERIRSVWHAVLYLSRAVKELAGREENSTAASVAKRLADRIGVALERLAVLRNEAMSESVQREIMKISAVLRGD